MQIAILIIFSLNTILTLSMLITIIYILFSFKITFQKIK